MFDNPGSKIKTFAKILFWVMVALGAIVLIIGCVLGSVLGSFGTTFIVYGIIIIVMGYFLSLLYAAFGELTEDVREIKATIRNGGNLPPQGYCSSCGTQNDPANKFCARCGKPLS